MKSGLSFEAAGHGKSISRTFPGEESRVSAIAIIAIIVGALIIIGLLVSFLRREQADKRVGSAQVQAQHDDLDHHRERADERRAEAELAQERAKRASAE